MKINEHFENAKKALDLAQDNLNAGNFVSAIQLLASSYSDVRELMEHAWRMKREAALCASPPGENVQ